MPEVVLSAQPEVIASGGASQLQWQALNADWCSAEGDWSGEQESSGSTLVENITEDSTFQIVCGSGDNRAVAMVAVNLMSALNLQWQAPTQNVDGSALTNLQGFNIYTRDDNGEYVLKTRIDEGEASGAQLLLAPGDHYFAVTAIDMSGSESGYSNEILKQIR
ncbi:MAG: hypothetical protein AB8B93_00390 [Pseudomonadales bacterium]